MPEIKDLSQMERDFSGGVSPEEPKMKKAFKQIRLPLAIAGKDMPELGDTVAAIIIGPVKGIENTEHSKEITIEAKKGGLYLKKIKGLAN